MSMLFQAARECLLSLSAVVESPPVDDIVISYLWSSRALRLLGEVKAAGINKSGVFGGHRLSDSDVSEAAGDASLSFPLILSAVFTAIFWGLSV
jgi:hypothetical protein